jgi:hypothetical protein
MAHDDCTNSSVLRSHSSEGSPPFVGFAMNASYGRALKNNQWFEGIKY